MSKVFTSILFRNVVLKNRIVVSPMCQYSAEDGFANDWHLVHLGSRAVGGAGMIISEACAVSPMGRITAHDLGIWKDEQIAPLKRITEFIEKQGSVAAIQLAHAGRKASCKRPWEGGDYLSDAEGAWPIAAPSAIPFRAGAPIPYELTWETIEVIKAEFKAAAQRALLAGFKVIEIHAAHGYLIHQFLSPLSNQRTDRYGGNFENRIRILLEIIEAIKEVWPKELPLFVRISATDWVDGGWQIEDSILLASILKDLGIDLIDCSSGGNIVGASIPVAPNYQVAFSKKIKQAVGIKTAAVGFITTAEQAAEILAQEAADLVIIGREFLRNPYFVLNAAKSLQEDIEWPLQYQRAK